MLFAQGGQTIMRASFFIMMIFQNLLAEDHGLGIVSNVAGILYD